MFLVYSIALPSSPPTTQISAFSVFFIENKRYVMLQFQLSRLYRLEIALLLAPSCSSWAASEKASIFFYFPLCTTLKYYTVFFFFDELIFGPCFCLSRVAMSALIPALQYFGIPLLCRKIMKVWIVFFFYTNLLILKFQNTFPLSLQFWIAAKYTLCHSMSTPHAHQNVFESRPETNFIIFSILLYGKFCESGLMTRFSGVRTSCTKFFYAKTFTPKNLPKTLVGSSDTSL